MEKNHIKILTLKILKKVIKMCVDYKKRINKLKYYFE